MLVIGIDVGGTHTKFGLVENGNIIRSMELGTNTFDVIRQICNGARELVQATNRSWEEVDGVAVGFPGMVIDSVVMDSPNINLQTQHHYALQLIYPILFQVFALDYNFAN